MSTPGKHCDRPATSRLRRALAGAVAVAAAAVLLAIVLSGCGKLFKLPTESPGRTFPGAHTYGIEATWGGMEGVHDILLTPAGQLFVLTNDGTSPIPRGEIRAYPKLFPDSLNPPPLPGFPFRTLLNPAGLCTDENNIYVLDQGDTCAARRNPDGVDCSAAGGWGQYLTDLSKFWRVREYNIIGSGNGGLDTISTFTDTTMSWVEGVAADAQGRVYVAGTVVVAVPDPVDERFKTLTYFHRIYRYLRGPRYAGVFPPDGTMPGAAWHRDSTWLVDEGAGSGFVQDPRGIYWRSTVAGSAVYSSDAAAGRTQMLSDLTRSTAYFQITADGDNAPLLDTRDVYADQVGHVYVCDTGHAQVLRYDRNGGFEQRVDIEKDRQGQSLQHPVAVAADSEIVFIGDPQLGKVLRYRRR